MRTASLKVTLTLANWKPLELPENWTDVVAPPCFGHQSCGGILDCLEPLDQAVGCAVRTWQNYSSPSETKQTLGRLFWRRQPTTSTRQVAADAADSTLIGIQNLRGHTWWADYQGQVQGRARSPLWAPSLIRSGRCQRRPWCFPPSQIASVFDGLRRRRLELSHADTLATAWESWSTAKLSLFIVHCNAFCCIMMLHNSTRVLTGHSIWVSVCLSLALSFRCFCKLVFMALYIKKFAFFPSPFS